MAAKATFHVTLDAAQTAVVNAVAQHRQCSVGAVIRFAVQRLLEDLKREAGQ
jgi:hypothetical protein